METVVTPVQTLGMIEEWLCDQYRSGSDDDIRAAVESAYQLGRKQRLVDEVFNEEHGMDILTEWSMSQVTDTPVPTVYELFQVLREECLC